MARFNKKKFLAEDLHTMTKVDMMPLLKQARAAYQKQAATFSRNESVYSHAKELMDEWYSEHGSKPISKMKKSEIQPELYRLQEFFGSKTSTVTGARKVAIETDRRIFGTDESGRPLFRMKRDEAANFWANYHAFEELDEAFVRNVTSDFVQNVLGEWMKETYLSFRKAGMEIDPKRIMHISFMDDLKAKIRELKGEKDVSRGFVDEERNLLSGGGTYI